MCWRSLLSLLTPERCGWLILLFLIYATGVLSGLGIEDARNAHLLDKLGSEERYISILELDCRSGKASRTVPPHSEVENRSLSEPHP